MKFTNKKSQAAFDAAIGKGHEAAFGNQEAVTTAPADTKITEPTAENQEAKALVEGTPAQDAEPRFKKPVTVILPEKSFVRGKYVYTPEIAGKTRWFAVKDVEVEDKHKDGLIRLTGEHRYFAKRGMEVAAQAA